ncbi:MAG: hypothetical protein JXM70_04515 [Pirellulales bacterium]|nr:hypothetical protein [Pirellulales bacterium]
MSGQGRCFCAVVLCLGVSWACGADNGADKKSTDPTHPKASRVSGLEILSRPPALNKGEKLSPEAAIRRALETRVRANFAKAPLNEVCGAIEKQLGIPVLLDRWALDDDGLDPETSVSCSMKNTRLRSALDIMLREVDLTWIIHREVLLITTTAAAQDFLTTRVYDVTDLATAAEPGYTDIVALVELLTEMISPESWTDVGGEGSIAMVEGNGIRVIAISQTFKIHSEIEKLLANLCSHIPRNTDKKDAGKKDKPDLSEEETIRRSLQKKIGLNFKEAPLFEVVDHLKELLQIEIQLDKRSLMDEGLNIKTPISFQISSIPAATAMDLMLRELDLTYIVKDDFLLVLTKAAEEESFMHVKIYNVADMIGPQCDYCTLIDAITTIIKPECWTDVGGEGSINCFNNTGMKVLVVSQTQRIHDDIKKLLADLRKVRREGDDGHVAPLGMGPNMGMEAMWAPGRRPGMDNRAYGSSEIIGSGRRSPRHRTRKPMPVEAYPARDALVKGNNQFAFDLYGRLCKDKPGENLFFSPMSISTAIAMISAGARGKTKEEIIKTMQFTLSDELLHPACRSLLEISQRGNSHELKIANRLWAQRDYKLRDDFLTITKKYYGAECALVDFVGKPHAAIEKINKWVAGQTRNRIRNIIGPGNIDGNTRLILANAIYFKGLWSEPFETRDTKPAPFFLDGGEKQVKMMSMGSIDCRYAEINDQDIQILEKPYDESFDLSMMILLPKREPGSLTRLEAALTEEKLAAWSKQLKRAMVMIYLPKLHLETKYLLNEQLMQLGMRSAFHWKLNDPNSANLSGMDDTLNIFLKEVIHKAYVDVDESGTEAAAATVIAGAFGGSIMITPSEPPEFRADHPFVFLIRDNRTGSILFLGRFCGPE